MVKDPHTISLIKHSSVLDLLLATQPPVDALLSELLWARQNAYERCLYTRQTMTQRPVYGSGSR